MSKQAPFEKNYIRNLTNLKVGNSTLLITAAAKVYLVVMLVLLVYSPIVGLFFASPDDPWMLLKNSKVIQQPFNVEYVYRLFDIRDEIQFSPLNTLYYFLIYKVNGYDPYVYHIASLVIHFINIILVYISVVKILDYFDIERGTLTGYVTALVWSIHPLNVESVVWISASKVLLFSLFTLLSLVTFLKSMQEGALRYFLLSFMSYFVACLCKEQAIVLPFMYIIVLLLNRKKTQKDKRKLKLKSLWFFIPAIIVMIYITHINLYLNSDRGFVKPIEKYSLWENCVLSFYCLRFYLTSLLFPINLHFHYSYPFSPDTAISLLYLCYPFLFISLVFVLLPACRGVKNKQFYVLCLLSFFIHIGLTLQIFPLTRKTIMADRYMYLPLVFLLIPLITSFLNLRINNRIFRAFKMIVLVLFVLSFCYYSNQLVKNWSLLNLSGYE